ncbi:MAG: hypothetical protein EOP19_22790 [Hyphomicrobiales bacterium]|nr:MAG: hypothetical protein EOP19_22790 [Hyphomicrobiales bacterium]
MLNWLILVAAAVAAAILLRKTLPTRWAQAIGTAIFWLFATIAAMFFGFAVWTASGIASGQVFWIIFAAVQIGGAVLFLTLGRVFQRLLVA